LKLLAELFPGSVHVFDTGLVRQTSDETIWGKAGANGFTIVTADSDFLDLAKAGGSPPKVVQRENCNYRTTQADELLRRYAIRKVELERSSRAPLVIRPQLADESPQNCGMSPGIMLI